MFFPLHGQFKPLKQLFESLIMTKFKSSMATRGITHLATYTLPVLVIQSVFSLLPLGRYPLPITTSSRYQPTDSSGKLLYTTISRNVTFVRCRMSLVTILLLDLVVIHWICWIQWKSFRENSSNVDYVHDVIFHWIPWIQRISRITALWIRLKLDTYLFPVIWCSSVFLSFWENSNATILGSNNGFCNSLRSCVPCLLNTSMTFIL